MAFIQMLRKGLKISVFLQEVLYKPLKQPNEPLPNQKSPKVEISTMFNHSKDKNSIRSSIETLDTFRSMQ